MTTYFFFLRSTEVLLLGNNFYNANINGIESLVCKTCLFILLVKYENTYGEIFRTDQTIKTSNKCSFFSGGVFSLSLNSFPDDSCCRDYSFIGKKTCVGWKFLRRFWLFSVQQLPMFCTVLIDERGAVSFKDGWRTLVAIQSLPKDILLCKMLHRVTWIHYLQVLMLSLTV